MRLLILILFAVLALFQYDLWFGRNGFFDYRDTAAKIVENQAENEKLSQRNQRINAEIQGLTKGFEAIEDEHGAILAIPVTDTIKRADNQQCIVKTEDRRQLWQAMTPQFFPVDILRNALSTGIQQGVNITDEASAMELAGFRPHLVAGRSDNLKVTRPEDLALAEFYLTRNKL